MNGSQGEVLVVYHNEDVVDRGNVIGVWVGGEMIRERAM